MENISKKENHHFNVENLCFSITEKLLTAGINFAKSSISIQRQDLSIIVQSHKILLFHNSESWVKKAGNKLFDVSMGCYDDAEVWQLVDSFILCKLASITKKSYIGVYRDDGLEIF